VRDKPDVIVTGTNQGTHAAKRATRTIPIVMIVGTDVIKEGFVASLGRPGGNITGLTWDVGVVTMAKRFEFLKEALPGLSRVAVLWDSGADAAAFESAIKEGAASVGLKLVWLKVTDDLEPLFAEAQRAGAQAIFTGGGARLFRMRKEVVALSARYRLPDTHYSGEFVEAGGAHVLRPGPARHVQASGNVHRQDPARRETRGASHRAADPGRPAHQSEDRQSPRSRASELAPAARRPRDRMTSFGRSSSPRPVSELGLGEPVPQINSFIEAELERHGAQFSGQGRPDLLEGKEVRAKLNETFRRAIAEGVASRML